MRLAFALTAVLLAGCRQEQSFDERYAEAQHKLEAKSAAIEKDLSAAQSDAASAEGQGSEAPVAPTTR